MEQRQPLVGMPLPGPQQYVVLPANAEPSHHFKMTIFVTIVCGFLNVSSLILGIPAIIVASAGLRSASLKQHAATKILGYVAFSLNIINIVYTMLVGVAISVTVYSMCYARYSYSDNYYYYDYYYSPC